MTATTRIGLGPRVRGMRATVHLWVVVATALALAAPIWLGPAAPWVLRELGASEDHHCACGMEKGKCGCLECAAAEKQDRLAKEHHAEPIVKSTCGSDDDVPFFAALPVVTLPASSLLAAPSQERLSIALFHVVDPSRERGPPSPPPPKSSSVSNLPV